MEILTKFLALFRRFFYILVFKFAGSLFTFEKRGCKMSNGNKD